MFVKVLKKNRAGLCMHFNEGQSAANEPLVLGFVLVEPYGEQKRSRLLCVPPKSIQIIKMFWECLSSNE